MERLRLYRMRWRTLGATLAFCALTDPAHAQDPQPAPMEMDHGAMDHGAMDHGAMGHDMGMGTAMQMTGALGGYAMTREGSGTSWQPDASSHSGVHWMAGGWMGMTHAALTAVYDDQSGPRGDTKSFLAGMVMASAQRSFSADDTLNLRVMLSPDPFMGKRGYPLLLAGGETADGVTPLVDRQHPHELVMELSASCARRIGADASWFVYAGLPGEPAFGPPAFMHRQSAMDFPIAPITHHWLDSTHVTFGVVPPAMSGRR
jgi:hypothetical protein